MCKNLSPGQIGTTVFIAGKPVAKLSCFQPVYPIPPNTTPASHKLIGNYCDLAIATYEQGTVALAQMNSMFRVHVRLPNRPGHRSEHSNALP